MNFTEKIKKSLFNFLFDSLPNQYSICEENNILGLFDESYVLTKTENFVGGITLKGINYNAITENDTLDLMLSRINASML
ncbi:ATPase [Helicobacter fennelliae]|uniref:Uncharacterized protein n=2 Tax=Helicobacter fennelliae TaxID=215 RepID=T1DW33_9HELI|nr:hypothetical protein [uncultured Helicobacter sp.]GAD19082.1 hypothetical protein HFN_0213 [Helicobacter fennelliae MRY12-0050]SQB98335.1 ATPase [Helicobacter fennelliae]STP14422.1 ATPase [Helicobacter fennelliae]STQ84444.1 ATPase [Helicobacter fennelliae]